MTDPRQWAETLFQLVDRFDADALAARMVPDGVLISVNDAPVVGRDGMRAAVRAFKQAVTSISHEVLRAWRAGAVRESMALRLRSLRLESVAPRSGRAALSFGRAALSSGGTALRLGLVALSFWVAATPAGAAAAAPLSP